MATRPQRPGRRGPDKRGSDRRGTRGAEFGDERMLEDTVVKLYRCATVVKGGRRFSFGALVVVGDRQGQVGVGYGKANEVPPAVEKGIKLARRSMFRVPLRGTTIPHRVVGQFGASRIVLIPASQGTGVIAGAASRAVLELAGVKDVLTKSHGSTSPKNLVKATINGLKMLRTRAIVEALRGVALDLPPERKPLKATVGVHLDREPVSVAVGVEELGLPADDAGLRVAPLAPERQETPHDA
jgi:small subunit ribosomal protein S5